MMSFTLTLSGNETKLDSSSCPHITLDIQKDYEIELEDFQTFNSIPNIDSTIDDNDHANLAL